MASLAKRLSEAVLSTVTNDLKPDIPAHNKLKRSWEEHEKRRFNKMRQSQRNMKQIAANTKASIRSLASSENSDRDFQESISAASIPGFRFKANGEAKKKTEETRQNLLMKSFTGLSKHALERKLIRHNRSVYTSRKPSSESMFNTSVDEGEETDLTTKKPKSFGFSDENASMRIRKVQEQLGLNRPPGQVSQGQKGAESDTDLQLSLENAFKMLHKALRKTETDMRTIKSLDKLNSGKKTTMKQMQYSDPCNTQGSSDDMAACRSTSVRDRCQACAFMPHRDVRELVKCIDPALYKKPRWKLSPSGRIVPPPLKTLRITYPSLYHWSQSGVDSKDTSKSRPQSSKAYGSISQLPTLKQKQGSVMPNTSRQSANQGAVRLTASLLDRESRRQDWRSSVDSVVTAVTALENANRSNYGQPASDSASQVSSNSSGLVALKRKNNLESQVLEGKMQQFLKSLSNET